MAISLEKNQKVSLVKAADGRALDTISFGLGWSGKARGLFGLGTKKNIDLDASCVVVRNGFILESIWFGGLRNAARTIRHSGDDRTGRHGTSTDNEIITVDANHQGVGDILVFTVNSFSGERFSELSDAHLRITDDSTGTELVRFRLSDFGNHTGLIVGALLIKPSDYEFQAIEKVVEGRRVHDLHREILRLATGV